MKLFILFLATIFLFFIPLRAQEKSKGKATQSISLSPFGQQYSGRLGSISYHYRMRNLDIYAGIGFHYNRSGWNSTISTDAGNGYARNFGNHLIPHIGLEYYFVNGNASFYTFGNVYLSNMYIKAGLNTQVPLNLPPPIPSVRDGSDSFISYNTVYLERFSTVGFSIGLGTSIKLSDRFFLKGQAGISSTIYSGYTGIDGKKYKGYGLDGIDFLHYAVSINYQLKRKKK